MERVLIKNIGTVVTGDINKPKTNVNTILIENGIISRIGVDTDINSGTIIDANGMFVMPGLIDSHIHPVLGDYTPRQNSIGFIESEVHGGVTSFISAGEVHAPGRIRGNKDFSMALAITANIAYRNFRPLGAKIYAGALMLEKGMNKTDFQFLKDKGVWLIGEVGLSSVQDPAEAAIMLEWGRALGMKAHVHTGGASIPGSTIIDENVILEIKPNIVSHINGGPTSISLDGIAKIINSTNSAVEIAQCGNFRSMLETVKLLAQRNELSRLIIGNDAPSGSGLMPLGVLRTLATISSLARLPPEIAIAAATGNTSRVFGLNEGVISEGKPADLVLFDAPLGSVGEDGLEALSIGDLPSIALVMIDGKIEIVGSRNTPPPKRQIKIESK
jgi:enamidase